MGLLEEEWSGAGIADMVWSDEEDDHPKQEERGTGEQEEDEHPKQPELKERSEEEESEGPASHHHHADHQQELDYFEEVKEEEEDPATESSNQLLNNFGPLEIGILENGRWDYFRNHIHKTTKETQTHRSKHIEATLVSIVFSVRCKFGFPTRVLHIERKEGILDLKINFTGQ